MIRILHIRKSFFDIKKSIFWYQIIYFLISKNTDDFLISRNTFSNIKKYIFWYQEIHFLISRNTFSDIKYSFSYIRNSNSWYQNIIFWYQEINFEVVFGQNRQQTVGNRILYACWYQFHTSAMTNKLTKCELKGSFRQNILSDIRLRIRSRDTVFYLKDK